MRSIFGPMLSAFCFAKRCDIDGFSLQAFAEAAAVAETAQADAPVPAEQPTAEPDKRAAFEKLIHGEYKEEFGRKTQSIVDKRFKQTKALEAKAQRLEPLVRALAARYGVDAEDTEALTVAVEQESRPAATAAEKKPTEQAEPSRPEESTGRGAAALRIYQGWLAEGEQLKQSYPAFDMNEECKNPDFIRLVQGGVSLRTAYQAIHQQELLGGAMQYAAQKAEEAFAARMADRANRPPENGALPHAGAIFKPDVANMTRTQRERLERRAAKGEKILF